MKENKRCCRRWHINHLLFCNVLLSSEGNYNLRGHSSFHCRQVIEGSKVLVALEEQETFNERPKTLCVIADCGLFDVKKLWKTFGSQLEHSRKQTSRGVILPWKLATRCTCIHFVYFMEHITGKSECRPKFTERKTSSWIDWKPNISLFESAF